MEEARTGKHVKAMKQSFRHSLVLPGSKSITLRRLILAALAAGTSEIEGYGDCDDTRRMIAALQGLGVSITTGKGDAEESSGSNESLIVRGCSGRFSTEYVKLETGYSGTSTRLLLALSLLRKGITFIDGYASMQARPNKFLLDAMKHLGAEVHSTKDGYLPVTIRGPEHFTESVTLQGDLSSQYFSALLLIAPLLPAGLRLHVQGELVSKPYIDITLNEMKRFGVEVSNHNYQIFTVAGQMYHPTMMTVEGDASAASYWSALALIQGGTVTLENLGTSTRQGDYQFLKICQKLGATVIYNEQTTMVTGPIGGRMSPLSEEVNMSSMPDAAPTLMAIAPLIPGVTRITGLSTLRVKECDRIAAPAYELRKLGVRVTEGNDYIEIDELPESYGSNKIHIQTYEDHRMAMSFAVLGTRIGNLNILEPECVEKTYPQFWQDLESLYE